MFKLIAAAILITTAAPVQAADMPMSPAGEVSYRLDNTFIVDYGFTLDDCRKLLSTLATIDNNRKAITVQALESLACVVDR